MSLGLRYHAKYIIFKQDILILLKKASFLAIFTTGIGTRAGADSNENEPEPESLSLVVKKEPKSESGGDSKAGITPALVYTSAQYECMAEIDLCGFSDSELFNCTVESVLC